MQIVIDIPDTAYEGIINASNASGNWDDSLLGILCKGIANGTPLPKGHGRLIDADKLETLYGLEYATEYGNETAEQQAHSYDTMMMYEIADMIDNAPTIIEADKEDHDVDGI